MSKSKVKNDSFFDMVFEVVKLIPKGRATSFGAIANYLGMAKSARMVGYAMNASHQSHQNIPAHRVLNRNGLLTGRHHFHPPELMQELLEQENIEIVENQVQNWEKVFWNPNDELDLLK